VAFLYPAGGRRAEATVFFVSVSDLDPEPTGTRQYIYAVTARHVLRGLKSDGVRDVDIRLNRRVGGTVSVRAHLTDWTEHAAADVAIVPLAELPEEADHTPFPLRAAVNDDILRENVAGPGDDVLVAGLFSDRPGDFRNIPIVRAGTIAALPDEPIKTSHGTFPAYLVEARSTPGMSGCPVFLNLRGFRRVASPGKNPLMEVVHTLGREALTTGFYLLGVGHGHYDSPYRPRPAAKLQRLNAGIALVTPAERITDLVMAPREIASRKKAIEHRRQEGSSPIVADGRARRRPRRRAP
jgi:hypothetical protein